MAALVAHQTRQRVPVQLHERASGERGSAGKLCHQDVQSMALVHGLCLGRRPGRAALVRSHDIIVVVL